jgi:uncharacterized protein
VKVVVDTNVLIAGLLSPFGPPGEILRMVASGTLRLCFDARILTEYEEVLARPKFRFNAGQTQALMEHIQAEGFSVAGAPLLLRLPDPSDEPFLESAMTASEPDDLIIPNSATIRFTVTSDAFNITTASRLYSAESLRVCVTTPSGSF